MVAVGFPPSYELVRRFRLPGQELVDAVEEALRDLRWNYHFRSDWEVSVSIPMGFFQGGSNITIDIGKRGSIRVVSRSSWPLEWVDWGRNESNVRRFFGALADVMDDRRRLQSDDVEYDDD